MEILMKHLFDGAVELYRQTPRKEAAATIHAGNWFCLSANKQPPYYK